MRLELTFIILARTSDGELATKDIPTLPMVGDVNIFFNGAPGDLDFESEAEIMIAGELTLSGHLRSPCIDTHSLVWLFAAIRADQETFFSHKNQRIAEKVSRGARWN